MYPETVLERMLLIHKDEGDLVSFGIECVFLFFGTKLVQYKLFKSSV